MRPIAARKQISLNLEPAPEHTDAFCDSQAIYQILSNLLDNAIKYTAEGGVIQVGSRPFTDSNGTRRIEVSVRDTGAGIPPEDLPTAF